MWIVAPWSLPLEASSVSASRMRAAGSLACTGATTGAGSTARVTESGRRRTTGAWIGWIVAATAKSPSRSIKELPSVIVPERRHTGGALPAPGASDRARACSNYRSGRRSEKRRRVAVSALPGAGSLADAVVAAVVPERPTVRASLLGSRAIWAGLQPALREYRTRTLKRPEKTPPCVMRPAHRKSYSTRLEERRSVIAARVPESR